MSKIAGPGRASLTIHTLPIILGLAAGYRFSELIKWYGLLILVPHVIFLWWKTRKGA